MTAPHPYQGLPDFQFWRRAVTWAPPGALDPVVETGFRIGTDDVVATMGSCFAQHLSRHLAQSGLAYFVTETGPEDRDEARRRNFGIFSARYGNVYTVAQAVQLFDRAYGRRESAEPSWERGDRLVDPYRPQVEPDGFADEEALQRDREQHLRATREVFENATVLVLTLGLTEAWRRIGTGDVFPTAPGVAGGAYDPEHYEFVNFGISENRDQLFEFCHRVRSVNPTAHILLTVSPVPLVATHERRHVLVSTTYSKAVLRVAADEATRAFDFVDYFPSFEIITSAASGRSDFGPDLREVDETGVRHVMRCFTAHYVDGRPWAVSDGSVPAGSRTASDIVCDEDAIAEAIERSTVRTNARSADSSSSAPVDALAWNPSTLQRVRAAPSAANGARTPAHSTARRAWRAIKRRARATFGPSHRIR